MGTIDHKEVIEAEAVVGETTRPEATMSVGNYQARSDDVCHKCGGQGHWARDCPNGPPTEQPATPLAPAVTKVVDYKAERGWVGAEFRDEPIRCMLDLGIQRAAIGEKFLIEGLWKRGTHH